MMLREFSAGLALPFVWLGRAIASVYVNYMALVGLLPRPLGERLARVEPYSFAILLVAIFLLPNLPGVHLDLFTWLVGLPASLLEGWLYHLTGLI